MYNLVTMATTDLSVTLEKIERNSSFLRRNSTGNFDSETTATKVLPHYLQASAHSCHDYCKYGNKNTSETKARIPFPRRFSAIPDRSHHLSGTPSVVLRNRNPVITPKPSRDVKSQLQLNKCEVVNKESPRSTKKLDAFPKQVIEPKDIDLKPKLLKLKPSSLSSSKSVIRRYSDIIIPTKGLGAKEVCPLGCSSSRRNIETEVSKDIRTPKTSKKADLATVSTSPKPRVKTVLTKNAGNSKNPRKVLNITKHKSFRKVEATKQPIEEEVPEKTLYVVEPSAEKRSNISLHSPKSEKEGSTKGHNGVQTPKSPESKEDREKKSPDQKAENKRRPIKVGKMTSDDGDCSPRKLKFRRGKVVTVWSESSSPRKLKFRPGKVLGENQNGPADETRVGRVRRLVSGGALNGNKTESTKVVLRHQDVEGRKDTQSLYNNVIEETASKLVETRKSKVKALVGAFESLISLQDTKPSETN